MTTSLPAQPRITGLALAPERWRVLLAFALVYSIWGSTYAGIRVALEALPPLLMAGARFVIAGLILTSLVRAPVLRRSAPDWRHAALSGALMFTVGAGLVHWAEQRVPSNLAALIICVTPPFMVLLDWLRPGGTRPSAVVLAGLAVGFGGMVLLVGASSAAGVSALGVAALTLSGLAWAVGSLYTRYTGAGGTLQGAARQLIAGGAGLLVLSVVTGDAARFEPAGLSLRALLAFGHLVVFGSVVAYSAYAWLLEVSTPARVATTAYVTPIAATLVGWLLLDEALSPTQSCGAAVILAGVFLMIRR